MKNICENEIEIQEEIIDFLEENCSITMKEMAEKALTGLNMATKNSVEEVQSVYKNNDAIKRQEYIYCIEYTEVLAILEYYLIVEDYNKIPKEMIEFFEKTADREYRYKIDKTKTYIEQNISKKSNSIIVSLYREYFASEEEKNVLNQILALNELNLKKIEEYENSKKTQQVPEDKALIKLDKQSLWMKIINRIRRKLVKTV